MASFKELEKNKIQVEFNVSMEKFKEAESAAFLKQRGKFSVPGFRKGKAPRHIIEQHYGQGLFFEDALDAVFPEAYTAAIKELDIFPVSRPQDVDIKKLDEETGLDITADVYVKPEVTLGEYKGVEAQKITYEVTDEDVDKEIENVLEQNARYVDVERAAKNGDKITMDYKGSVDGEYFDGGSAERQDLDLGSGMFIPGFEEQVEGMSIGDEKSITVTFPEEYHAKHLAGKEAVFEVVLHEIKEKQLAEADDEFASEVSEFETLAEYKASIKQKREETAQKRQKQEQEDKVIEAVLGVCEVDIPECMVDDEVDNQIRRMEYSLSYQGLNMEQYMQYTGMTMDKLKEMQKESCENIVKTRLVLEAIKDKENFEISEAEMETEIEALVKETGADLEEYKKSITEEQKEYIKDRAVYSKLIDTLISNAKLK